jgi:hypothetical protein
MPRYRSVVPRDFDENFAKDGKYEHMQVATEGYLKNNQFVHFPINSIRPLPAKAGTMLGWYGNTIHWGGSCHAVAAADPRCRSLPTGPHP